ncbi:MAG: hypothetical protein RI922_724 [Bacteroidota bacterium]|jgi:hypothetical protein
MKTSLILILLLLCTASFASKELDMPGSYAQLDSIKHRKTLKTNESMFYFNFQNLPKGVDFGIIYDYNGGPGKTVYLGKNRFFEVKIKPGTYYFQLLLNNEYFEITTNQISVKSREKAFLSCYFQRVFDKNIQVVEKPVLYFYPNALTDISVKLEPKGNLAFSYPSYENAWSFKADPTGNLTFGNKTYNYLFWESKQLIRTESFDRFSGFVIDRDSTIQFLESSLRKFGLNDKEMADFITYWGPQLMKNDRNYIHFVFNDDCTLFAELTIEPKPAQINRIYILSHAIPNDISLDIQKQEIPTMNRTGFTVIEWGGSTINSIAF